LDKAGAPGGGFDLVGHKNVCSPGDCTAYISRHRSLRRMV
jgi:hypothetical protein